MRKPLKTTVCEIASCLNIIIIIIIVWLSNLYTPGKERFIFYFILLYRYFFTALLIIIIIIIIIIIKTIYSFLKFWLISASTFL